MELRNLRDRISSGGEKWELPRRFQAGVSFRSLCRRCNTELLGAAYDPALGEFSAQVRALANSPLALPASVDVMIRPQPVMRSVLGHLAAQGVDRYQKGPYTEPIRDYLLDPSLPPPAQLRMYYWLYPYRSTVLIRDAARIEHLGSGQGSVAFWLMKFYPLAFMVTLSEPAQRLYRMEDLDRFAQVPFAQATTVRLSFAIRRAPRGPRARLGSSASLRARHGQHGSPDSAALPERLISWALTAERASASSRSPPRSSAYSRSALAEPITAAQLRTLSEHQDFRCACGCGASVRNDYRIDQVTPLARGGRHMLCNLQLLARRCNLKKSAR